MSAPSNSHACLQELEGRRVVGYLSDGSAKHVVFDDGTAFAFTGTFWRESAKDVERYLLAEQERLERKDSELERVRRLLSLRRSGEAGPQTALLERAEQIPQTTLLERAEQMLIDCAGWSAEVVDAAASAAFWMREGVADGSVGESLCKLADLLELSAKTLPDEAPGRLAAASEARRLFEDVRREGLA